MELKSIPKITKSDVVVEMFISKKFVSNHFETDETQQNTESVLQNPKFVIDTTEQKEQRP